MNTNIDLSAANAFLNTLQTAGSTPCVVVLVPTNSAQNQLVSNVHSAAHRQIPRHHSSRRMIQSARMQPVFDRETLELANTVFSLYNRMNAQQQIEAAIPSPAPRHFGAVNKAVHSQSAIATPSSNAFADDQAVGNDMKMENEYFVVGRPSGSTEQREFKKEAIRPPPRPPTPNESEEELKVHSRRHTECQRYRCTMAGCDRSFKQRGDLRRHLNRHLNNGQFLCSQCGRRFVFQCDLTRHLRTHSKEKAFGCSLCHKRFAQKHGLKQHLATHRR